VLRLERSLGDVQVALPGLPAQDATAYLCGFAAGQGLRVAVALHLQQSGCLAFYLNDDGEIPRREAARVLTQALNFAESMGFMFGDMDIHLRSPEERLALWRSLPLYAGIGATRAGRATAAPGGHRPEGKSPAGAPSGPPIAGSPPAPSGKPGTAPRRPPTPAELAAKRERLRQNLGRFLASM
jgi:hypothetical protein